MWKIIIGNHSSDFSLIWKITVGHHSFKFKFKIIIINYDFKTKKLKNNQIKIIIDRYDFKFKATMTVISCGFKGEKF